MNAFQLKLLAVIAMIVDHIGVFFFPDVVLFRLIGRLAFPIFAWTIANGARHTRNVRSYALRLFGFAILSELPYHFAGTFRDPEFSQINVLFTLFIGLIAILVIQRSPKPFWPIPIIFLALIADLLHADYGSLGVLAVVGFYLFASQRAALVIYQSAIFLFPYLLTGISDSAKFAEQFSGDILEKNMQLFGLLALVPLAQYDNKPGKHMGYFFYLFYPLQFVVIIILQRMLL